MLNLGIIGLGGAARQMIPSLVSHPLVEVVGAADPRLKARIAFEKEFGAPAVPSPEELCARADIDVVYIATPHQMHLDHATIAARAGKHMIVEKPMALTLADCNAMIAVAGENGVKLLVGHTHAFDPAVLKMRELIRNDAIGQVAMINSFSYSNFLYRPRRPEELRTDDGGGIVFNQAPHQVDIVRLLGGGMVRSVRSAVFALDPDRPADGAQMSFLQFEDGAAASIVYSGYDWFDSDEFHFWVGELGEPKSPDRQGAARKALKALSGTDAEVSLKVAGGLGGDRKLVEVSASQQSQPHCGVTIVTGARGDLRQSARGVLIYDEEGRRETVIDPPRAFPDKLSVIDEIHGAIVNGQRLVHDGAWARATMEVCLAMYRSARERREIILSHQTPVND